MSDLVTILLVEDSEDDVFIVQRGFQEAKILNPIQVVRNGEEAIEYLSGVGRFSNRAEFPLPALVLLDLKMPGKDGFDVLRWIRSHPGLGNLRVVVLSGSDEMRDVNRAYQLGANSFLVKPVDFERFVRIASALSAYWLWADMAPKVSRGGRVIWAATF